MLAPVYTLVPVIHHGEPANEAMVDPLRTGMLPRAAATVVTELAAAQRPRLSTRLPTGSIF